MFMLLDCREWFAWLLCFETDCAACCSNLNTWVSLHYIYRHHSHHSHHPYWKLFDFERGCIHKPSGARIVSVKMYVLCRFGRVKCINEYWIHQIDDRLKTLLVIQMTHSCYQSLCWPFVQMKDGALVMDAVAQLPENAIFKYRLKTFDLKQLQGAVQDGQLFKLNVKCFILINTYNIYIYTYISESAFSLSRYIFFFAHSSINFHVDIFYGGSLLRHLKGWLHCKRWLSTNLWQSVCDSFFASVRALVFVSRNIQTVTDYR